MRAKAGRVLSAANRDRIAKALASKEAVLGAYADLEALLTETDPQAADAAKAALAARGRSGRGDAEPLRGPPMR
jgi:hypothetical protein